MKKQPASRLLLNFLLLLSVLVILIYLLKNSLGEIIREISLTPISILLMVVFLGCGFVVVEGFNYQLLIKPFNPKINWRKSVFTYCYSAFYRVITFGAGTLVAEVMFVRQQGLTTSQSMGVTSLHMMLYKAGVIFFSCLSLGLHFNYLTSISPYLIAAVLLGIGVTILVCLFLLLVSSSQWFHQQLIKLGRKLSAKGKWQLKLDSFNEQIISLRATIKEITTEKTSSLKLLALNILKLIPWYSLPYFIFKEEGNLSFILCFSLVSMASVLAGIIPSPAGIGSFDFIFVLLFSPLVGKVSAVSGLLLYRFATYFIPFIIGLIYTAKRKRVEIVEEIHELKK